ncbi:MAG TPA: hypothetical protein VN673_12480 [Clostridia bacterium]|nr:hypothetical protein [Clostridia bacterium]
MAVIPAPSVLDSDGLPRRNVRVASFPVTVGHITVENDVFSNRIRNKKDALPGCTLTFDGGTNTASWTVLGNQSGFTAVEMSYGVVLATDLSLVVSNIVGDAEYGALRLQGEWSGAGGLVKEGPGICTLTGEGKSYTGPTWIREGVMSFTEPACATLCDGVIVETGGQLRLTSGSSAGGPPSTYAFGGTVALASLGRIGFDGVSGAGPKGGLRYDPGGQESHAVLLSPVVVIGASAIHVDDPIGNPWSGNTLTLVDGLSGAAPLLKSGGGRLIVQGTAAEMEGPVSVANGLLQVGADMRNASIMLGGSSTWLCGTGRVGSVSGDGYVSPGSQSFGQLMAQSVGDGVDFAFHFTTIADESNGNDLLTLVFSEAPFSKVLDGANRIDVYLDTLPPEGGYVLGGFATEAADDFTRFIALADWHFYVPDINGSVISEGQRYSPCGVPLTIGTVAQGKGRILKIMRPAHGYARWCATYFSLAEQNDPAVSGPLARGADGVENLMRYALGLDRTASINPYLPQLVSSGGTLLYRYRKLVDEEHSPEYLVVTIDDLHTEPAQWQNVFQVEGLSVSLRTPESTDNPEVEIETLEIIPHPLHPVRFFRLRVMDQ